MACECCTEPITAIYLEEDTEHGDTSGVSTSAAWTAAVALIPSYSGTYTPHSVRGVAAGAPVATFRNSKTREPLLAGGLYGARAERAKYRWRFFTATCYFKVWWDEVQTHYVGTFSTVGTGTVTSTTSKSFEWTATSVGGLCVPSGFYGDFAGIATWPKSDDGGGPSPWEVLEQEPSDFTTFDHGDRIYVTVENVKWSWVSGYTPSTPADSGFPPPYSAF